MKSKSIQILPLPKHEDTKVRLDFRRNDKILSVGVLTDLCRELGPLRVGEKIDLVTAAVEGLRSDILAWGRLSGHEIQELHAENCNRYIITKRCVRKHRDRIAITISSDSALDLASPLGFALGAAASGMKVSIFFQGPAVRVLAKGYRVRRRGCFPAISRLCRKNSGHVVLFEPQREIRQLLQLDASLYVCHRSLIAFGIKEDEVIVDAAIIGGHVTFLEEMRDAIVQLHP